MQWKAKGKKLNYTITQKEWGVSNENLSHYHYIFRIWDDKYCVHEQTYDTYEEAVAEAYEKHGVVKESWGN